MLNRTTHTPPARPTVCSRSSGIFAEWASDGHAAHTLTVQSWADSCGGVVYPTSDPAHIPLGVLRQSTHYELDRSV